MYGGEDGFESKTPEERGDGIGLAEGQSQDEVDWFGELDEVGRQEENHGGPGIEEADRQHGELLHGHDDSGEGRSGSGLLGVDLGGELGDLVVQLIQLAVQLGPLGVVILGGEPTSLCFNTTTLLTQLVQSAQVRLVSAGEFGQPGGSLGSVEKLGEHVCHDRDDRKRQKERIQL